MFLRVRLPEIDSSMPSATSNCQNSPSGPLSLGFPALVVGDKIIEQVNDEIAVAASPGSDLESPRRPNC